MFFFLWQASLFIFLLFLLQQLIYFSTICENNDSHLFLNYNLAKIPQKIVEKYQFKLIIRTHETVFHNCINIQTNILIDIMVVLIRRNSKDNGLCDKIR